MVTGLLPVLGEYCGKQMCCDLREGPSLCLARRNAPVPTPRVISRSWLACWSHHDSKAGTPFSGTASKGGAATAAPVPDAVVTGF